MPSQSKLGRFHLTLVLKGCIITTYNTKELKMKPLTVKLNVTTVEMIVSLTEHYDSTMSIKLSKPQIIEMAIKNLIKSNEC